MLQGSDHTRLQTPFGDLKVSVQAIDQVNQQALVLQLAQADRTPKCHITLLIDHTELAVAAGVCFAELGVVGGQGIVEQFADSFHPAYSLFEEAIGTDHQTPCKVRYAAPVSVSMRGVHDSLNMPLGPLMDTLQRPLQARHHQWPGQLADNPNTLAPGLTNQAFAMVG